MPKYGQYDVPNADTMINFGTGQPNNLNLPIDWFQSVCAKMSTDMFGSTENEHKQLLQYGAISGYQDIKSKMAEWLTERYYNNLSSSFVKKTMVKSKLNYKIEPDQLFMTNGNTGALHLLMTKYTESADYIIVDNPTYFIAINMFKEYGLKPEGVNMDIDGVNLEELESKIIELNSVEKYKQSVLFYYMIPTHHNPTGITISHEKRLKLAELCDKYENLYIIADEVYHFLTFDNIYDFYPMADYHPKIITLGSFSKILAPALRVGWMYQNTSLPKYKDEYGFITGTTGLNCSSVLDSSGGINPIGFKFVEYALTEENGSRPIDAIIDKHNSYLQANCELMLEYLEQFKNISFIRPSGGYFLWLKLNTIKNTTEFLKLCERNKVKFHPGIKFTTDSSLNDCIRLSFSYYNSTDLITGLERLMDCIVKYNSINIKINGATGKLGTLIKKQVLGIKDFNYLGDIKRTITKSDFDGLIPFNTVLIDVSSNEGTKNLLNFLLVEKLYYPLIVGTTGLDDYVNNLMRTYAGFAPVVHLTNFSEGVPLIREFAKLSNGLSPEWKFKMVDIHHVHKKDAPSGTAKTIKSEIIRDIPIESIRTGEVIGEHVLELTNGSETIKIIHSVSNRDTFAKGCINYIYWILSLSDGLYNKMEPKLNLENKTCVNESIIYGKLDKDIPQVALNHFIKSILATNKDLTRVCFVRELKDSKLEVQLFDVTFNKINPMSYCGYTLYKLTYYIWDEFDVSEGRMLVDNQPYKFQSTSEYSMVKLPNPIYIDDKKKDNSINELINQISNLTLFGVGRYQINNQKYLVLEIKNNVFNSDMLSTISTVVNAEQSDCKYNVVFVNTKLVGDLFMRYYDSETNEEQSDAGLGCVVAFEYYMYHFVKDYKNTKSVSIKIINNKQVNLTYNNGEFYISDVIYNKKTEDSFELEI